MAAKKIPTKKSDDAKARAPKPSVNGEPREHRMIDARTEREAVKARSGKSRGAVTK